VEWAFCFSKHPTLHARKDLLGNMSSRIMETQIFHHAKIESSKNSLKETKNLRKDMTTL
jgi:hypothetical protein